MKLLYEKSKNIIFLNRRAIVELKWMKRFPDDMTRAKLEAKNELGLMSYKEEIYLKWKRAFPNNNKRAYLEKQFELGIATNEEIIMLKWLKKLNNNVKLANYKTKCELNKLKLQNSKNLISFRKPYKQSYFAKKKQQAIDMNNVAVNCIKEYGKVIEFNKNM